MVYVPQSCWTRPHSRAHDRHHPCSVAVGIADVCDHLIEISYRGLVRHRRQFADGLCVSVAPGFDDGGESVTRHAHRVHYYVIYSDLLEVHRGEDAKGVPSNEQVDPGCRFEAWRDLVPKISRVEHAALKVEHAVILWNEVQLASMARHPRKLSDHAVRVRD